MPPIRKQPSSSKASVPLIELNGILYTTEDLVRMQSSIEVISPDNNRAAEPVLQEPSNSFESKSDQPVQNRTGHTLKLLGYWADLPEWRLAFAGDNSEPAWPDVRRAVQPGWCQNEREKLLTYLQAGYIFCTYCGYSSCRFKCCHTYSLLGTAELTDGEWVWPDGLVHYIDRHSVALPEEFLQSIRARQWTLPPLEEVLELVPKMKLNYCGEDEYGKLFEDYVEERIPETEVSPYLWLQWAEALPRLEEVQTDPDPDVMQRARLVIQIAKVHGISKQVNSFRSQVIDEVRQRYGIPAGHWDNDNCIDLIHIGDLEQVIAEVMGGLQLYKLEHHAKVICGEPSMTDWQVDTDRMIWPL